MDAKLRDFLLSLQDKAQEKTVVNGRGTGVAGGYVFRGENEAECPDGKVRPVSSQLYRWVQGLKLNMEQTCLAELECHVVDEMNRMLTEPYPREEKSRLRSRMQHLGGKTNLIDFTRDFLIALFFACYDSKTYYEDSGWETAKIDGRIIFLPKRDERIIEPQIGDTRAIAQKSVFFCASRGVLPETEYETMKVPSYLKNRLICYLAECHDIKPKTIFPDFPAALQYMSSNAGLGGSWDLLTSKKGSGYR